MTIQRATVLLAAAGLAQTAIAQCPPSVPTMFFATQGTECNSIFLDWQDVSGANNYNIYRNTVNNYNTSGWVGTAVFGNSQFTDLTAFAGTRYYYWVTAHRNLCLPGSATGSPAGPAQGWKGQDPVAPTNVAASDGAYCGAVRVTWNQPAPDLGANVIGYTIYRNTINLYLTSSSVGTAGGSAREFFDTTAEPATTYYYWVRAENDCGTAASSGDSGYISNLPPPSNDNCANAQPVLPNGTYIGSTVCATRDGIAPCGASGNQGRDVWYRFFAPSDGILSVDTCGVTGSFNTVLSLHLDTCPGVTANSFACNDNGCGAQSMVEAPVNGGAWYLIRVGGYSANDMGNYELHVNFTPTGPACYANCDGSSIAPILNVNDFVCFQQKFAAGDPYANCDNSSVPPILNVNDFVCFQQQFAAGCP